MTIAITSEFHQPARYLGNELGSAHKPWETARVRWVLTYPEVYEVGASNLGHIILYNILNAQPRQLCDRAYLPGPDLAKALRDTQTPLFAVESRRALTDFDILGFSLSYELGATNILEMLDLAGIPLTWKERQTRDWGLGTGDWVMGEGRPQLGEVEQGSRGAEEQGSRGAGEQGSRGAEERGSGGKKRREKGELVKQLPNPQSPIPNPQPPFPLIFAGGQTATSNPEPYADFFDFFALGDGEELLAEIGLVIEEGKTQGLSREELLLDLAQIPGVYVPQFYDMAADGSVHPNRPDVPQRILRRVATPIPAYSIGLVPYVQTVHDRLIVEIRRGCTRGCRFCQPGMLTRPARDVEPEKVIEAIEKGMRATGHNEFSLLSLSCSDYLALPAVGMEIKNRLKNENISLSLPSQRVDRFDDNIADIIGGTRQGGLTFAPEAGTQRMRDIVNKGLTNEELLRGVKTAFDRGWDKIKLYFMIGLPGETDADAIGIAETVRWLQQKCWGKGRKLLNFNITISNFTPKPHTPFQWHSVSSAEFERKQNLLRGEFRRMKGVKANFTDVRLSAMEDFIGRGDRRLGAVLRRAWEEGAGMDAWFDSVERAYAAWGEAIAASGLTWKYRKIENGEWNLIENQEETTDRPSASANSPLPDLDKPLPWDHINTGIDKEWLKADLKKALEAATVPDCSFEGCSHCGVCTPDFGHNIVIEPLPIPAFEGDFKPNSTRTARLRVWFGKLGDMALVSHLDLVRLFDRVARRASLPISFTGGYHPSPRIAIAHALPLGATSASEIVDFELTEPMDATLFGEKLAAHLPAEIPIYRVEVIDLKAGSASLLLQRAEYYITVAAVDTEADEATWQTWVEAIAASETIEWEKTTKSGQIKSINLRDRLFELERVNSLPDRANLKATQTKGSAVLRYIGSCLNDGTMLRPEHLIYMLERVAGIDFQLLHTHRNQLLLEPEVGI